MATAFLIGFALDATGIMYDVGWLQFLGGMLIGSAVTWISIWPVAFRIISRAMNRAMQGWMRDFIKRRAKTGNLKVAAINLADMSEEQIQEMIDRL